MVYYMVLVMLHNLTKNTFKVQVFFFFFVMQAYNTSLNKEHKILCTKISNSSSPSMLCAVKKEKNPENKFKG